MNSEERLKIKDEIIEASLPHIPFDGWKWETIVRGAEDCGYDEITAQNVFPKKEHSALIHFSNRADRAMLDAIKDLDPAALRVRDRVAEALMARFTWLAPHREAVQASLTYSAHPKSKIAGAKIIWRTADIIWNWAGDTSTDYNRYTKRSLLGAVIAPTTWVWLKDTSEDQKDTRAFLEKRLDNVVKVGGTVGRVIGKISKLANFGQRHD